MKQRNFRIGQIPALLWGEPSDRLIIAVHGNLSHKADTVIERLAQQVVDMERLIGNMMTWFSASEERLQTEGEVSTPIGQTLYWDYYQYVKTHPVNHWNTSTAILYGSADNLCERDTVEDFTRRFGCDLIVLEGGEHFFHTGEQLAFYESWIRAVLR